MVYPKWDSLCLVVHVPTCLLTPQEPLCFLFPVIIHLSEGRNNTDVRVMKKATLGNDWGAWFLFMFLRHEVFGNLFFSGFQILLSFLSLTLLVCM